MPKAKAEYYPKREATLADWLAIPLLTIVALAAMMFLGGTVVVWLGRIIAAILLAGVGINYFAPFIERSETVGQGKRKFRALVLSDPHIGLFTRPWLRRQLAALIKWLNDRDKIDYVFWTGDYIGLKGQRWTDAFRELVEEARTALPDAEMFACAGGHEVEGPWEAIADIFEKSGVYYRENGWAVSADGGVAVWMHMDTEHPSRNRYTQQVRNWWYAMYANMPARPDIKLCLCHNPDDIDAEWAGTFDLILSGHWHRACRRLIGGTVQIVAPAIGAAAEFFGRGLPPCRFLWWPGVVVIEYYDA